MVKKKILRKNKNFSNNRINLKKGSMTQLAYFAIKNAGKPLHQKEIYKEVMKSFKSKGSTPNATLISILIRNKHIFKRLTRGVYDLQD